MLRRIAIGLVLALLSSGCTMKAYEGPELPRSEIAVLDGMHWHGGVLALLTIVPVPQSKHEAVIVAIDGKQRSLGGEIHILPGQHTA